MPSRHYYRVTLTSPLVFDAQSYYQTIINNNLFLPLGWTPPRPKEPYRLIGTILPTDDRTPPKAILQTTEGNQIYIVTTGEKIDASTEVVEIKPKQVTLSTEGQQRALQLPSSFDSNELSSESSKSQKQRCVCGVAALCRKN